MNKTGGEGKKLTEADDIMLDILGRDSANIQPVDVKQFPVVFPGKSGNVQPTLSALSSPKTTTPTATDPTLSGDGPQDEEVKHPVSKMAKKRRSKEANQDSLTKLCIQKLRWDVKAARNVVGLQALQCENLILSNTKLQAELKMNFGIEIVQLDVKPH